VTGPTPIGRDDRLFPNAWLVARRELRERVLSRLFIVSTLLLAALAVGIALTPVIVRALDRGSTSTIAVVTPDEALAKQTISTMGGILGATGPAVGDRGTPPYTFARVDPSSGIADEVAAGDYDAALLVSRGATGGIEFKLITGSSIGDAQVQQLTVGMFAVSIFDWLSDRQATPGTQFVIPTMDVLAATGPSAGGQPIGAAEFASRRIVGVVFVVLIFITLVIYGMWVAAGVVAEKSSRVMELLISAASPGQLVIGKVVGIGLAGLVQYVAIVVPAIVTAARGADRGRRPGPPGRSGSTCRSSVRRCCSSTADSGSWDSSCMP
jgi:ABC-2 type transport system permease protein